MGWAARANAKRRNQKKLEEVVPAVVENSIDSNTNKPISPIALGVLVHSAIAADMSGYSPEDRDKQ